MPRSDQNPTNTIRLINIKELIEGSKADIILSLKRETDRISEQLTHIIKRVNDVEQRTLQLEKRCALLETKSNESSASILDEMEDRLRRKKSLIISGMPEVEGTIDERKESDSERVEQILRDLSNLTEYFADPQDWTSTTG